MEHAHVKSTIAIDPVRAALTKAELLAVKGQRADAIQCLREALADYPGNDELEEKLRKIQAMPEPAAAGAQGSSGSGRVLLVVGLIVVAMVVLYSVVL
ncbi:MAG: hypothetical protein HUJ28_04855 [Chromatiales bacterium]|nr:hypothetical protein [Chromatiales bacterium]